MKNRRRCSQFAGVMALGLAACGAGDQRADSVAPDGSGTIEAARYIAQFTQDDPGACFDESVALARADLRGASDAFGSRAPPTRVAVMIDGSGSMAGRIGSRTKLELAREAVLGFVDGLPPSVQTSLLVFGQQGDNSAAGKAQSCRALDVLAPMSTDRIRLRDAVGQVRAVGWTPLAAGLGRAEAMLAASATPGEQLIYVVSDGEETCGGDPVAAARRINTGQTKAIVNVIGFDLPPQEAASLRAVAQAGGGGFVNVATEAELERVAAQVRESNRKARNAERTANAVAGNAVQVSNAISHAEVCVSDIVSRESVRIADDLSRRAANGESLPYEDEAQARLKARHDALQARLADYRRRLTTARETTERQIAAENDAVR